MCKTAVNFCYFVLFFIPTVCQSQTLHFSDVTESSQIQFQHYSPLTEARHLHLFMGSGIAWIDHDRDGWPDLYICQGTAWPRTETSDTAQSNQLWANQGGDTFSNITKVSGLVNFDYSMGTAVGDFDNDGFPDLFVTSYGKNRMYRNNGDGTWHEIGTSLGMADERFGSSCTWADVDNDGNLDLYVVNYLKLDPNDYPLGTHKEQGRTYAAACHPRYQKHECDILYSSNGDGSFTDITAQAGLKLESMRCGLGVVACDLDGDADLDFYVANDTVHNQLWANQGAGTFLDDALLSGVAVNRSGSPEAGMGAVVGDVDGDGLPDLFVTNYYGETNTLYRNEGTGFFLDVTDEFGLGSSSRLKLGFGTSLFDFDNDGWLDLFVANGHVHDLSEVLGRNEPFAQRPQLFQNQGGQRFTDASDSGGPYFQRPVVGRSCAVADYDRDGWQDLAIGHLNSSLVLLHNQTHDTQMNSLRIELVGVRSNRSAIGAALDVHVGENRLTRFRIGSSGYLSCDEGCLTIGVGTSGTPVDVTVRWPDGESQTYRTLQTGRRNVLIQGRQLVQ